MAILRRVLLLLTLAAALTACGGDDDGDGDGSAIDAPAATDGTPGIDAAACVLPATVTTCTVGDDSPCTALCGGAYCYNYNQLPSPVCTNNCTPGSTTECPTGWSCNNMGRCRPPG